MTQQNDIASQPRRTMSATPATDSFGRPSSDFAIRVATPISSPRDADIEIRPQSILRVLKARGWIMIVSAFLTVALTVFLLSGATPRYVAYSQMLLGEQGLSSRDTFDLVESQSLTNSVIEGELAVLRSNALLVRVARRLELNTVPEFNAALRPVEEPGFLSGAISSIVGGLKSLLSGSEDPADDLTSLADSEETAIDQAAVLNAAKLGELESVIGKLRQSITVRQLGSSFVVQVSATSEDPRTAAAIVNTLMDEYIRFLSDQRFEAAQRFSSWLETRVEELAARLEASERDVFEFRAAIDAGADSSQRLEQQMQELTTRLVAERSELAEVRATLQKIRTAMETEGPTATANFISNDQVIDYRAEIGDLRRREATALRNFGEDSAQVLALSRSIVDVEADLSVEVEREISRLENQAAVLDVVVSSLETSLGAVSDAILGRSSEEIALNQLQRIADANQAVYQEFLGRFREVSEIQGLQTPDAEVISYAGPPTDPVFPRTRLSAVMAGVGGVFAGLAAIILLELLPKRLSSTSQLSQTTFLSAYGRIPQLSSRITVKRLATLMQSEPDGALAQAATQIASNSDIRVAGASKSIVVGSTPAAQSDKMLVAVMLAWAETQKGRSCLLVDADFRAAALTRSMLDGPHPDADLTRVLFGECEAQRAVIEFDDVGFFFMPTSAVGSDPSAVFDSKRFHEVVATLLETFDTVIFDAPASTDRSDVFTMRKSLNMGLFVVRSGQVTAHELDESLRVGSMASVDDLGLVLTGVWT